MAVREKKEEGDPLTMKWNVYYMRRSGQGLREGKNKSEQQQFN